MRRIVHAIVLVIGLTCLAAVADDGLDKPATKPAAASAVPKPRIVTREEWGSQPQPIDESHKQVPKYVTIHHAGTLWKAGTDPVTFVRGVQAYGQKEKNWPDLPYHFMIAPDGRIFEGRPIEYEPQSNTKYPLQG